MHLNVVWKMVAILSWPQWVKWQRYFPLNLGHNLIHTSFPNYTNFVWCYCQKAPSLYFYILANIRYSDAIRRHDVLTTSDPIICSTACAGYWQPLNIIVPHNGLFLSRTSQSANNVSIHDVIIMFQQHVLHVGNWFLSSTNRTPKFLKIINNANQITSKIVIWGSWVELLI